MKKITDIERMLFLAEKQHDAFYENPKVQKLVDILLGYDGQFVVLPWKEPDLYRLIGRGIIVSPSMRNGYPHKHLRINKMDACHCHENTASLWRSSKTLNIVTGYALSCDDPVWVQHSWLEDDLHIIETTTARKLYFGITLSDKESRKFYTGGYITVRRVKKPTSKRNNEQRNHRSHLPFRPDVGTPRRRVRPANEPESNV